MVDRRAPRCKRAQPGSSLGVCLFLWALALLPVRAVVQVSTAQELDAALVDMAPLIMVTQHLEISRNLDALVDIDSIAIWGNCSTALPSDTQPPDVPPEFIRPGMCALKFSSQFPITIKSGRLWISNLALYGAQQRFANAVAVAAVQANVYLVDSVVANALNTSIFAADSNLHVIGSAFVDNAMGLDSWLLQPAIDFLSYDNDNTDLLVVVDSYLSSALISIGVTRYDVLPGAPAQDQEQFIVFARNTFSTTADAAGKCVGMCIAYNASAQQPLPNIFSDGPYTFFKPAWGSETTVQSVDAVTWGVMRPPDSEAAWLTTLAQAGVAGATQATFDPLALRPAPPSLPPLPPHAKPTNEKRAGAIAGAVIGGLAVIALVTVAVLYIRRRRSTKYDAAEPQKASLAGRDASESTSLNTLGVQGVTAEVSGFPRKTWTGVPALQTDTLVTVDSSAQQSSLGSLLGSMREVGTASSVSAPRNRAEQMAMEAEVLRQQLDALCLDGTALGSRYRILPGTNERREGGQGVVQFCSHMHDDSRKYAVKFFLDRAAFSAERDLYQNNSLKGILPPVDDVIGNEDGFINALGRPLPPMVVIEKGEALSEWACRCRPDFPSCVQIVMHLVKRIADLHAKGYVHRDLKPSNCIFLYSSNAWTICDFGCCVPIGQPAALSYTLAYAAPETVLALQRCETKVIASAAVDVWALGMMFYELFSQHRVYGSNPDLVFKAMNQEVPLPWEDESNDKHAAELRMLGFMKDGILAMLQRDAAKRVSLAEVQRTWKTFLGQETTSVAHE